MSQALIPSDAQLATLARWIEEKLPALGPIQCFERLASPRRAERIAFVRVHGGNGQVDVAAKRPMRWSKIDEGDVELVHLRHFRAAGMQATPLLLGYDADGGLLWTVVMPSVPLQHWLFHHLYSPSRRLEHQACAAVRRVGRWLASAQSLPYREASARRTPSAATRKATSPRVSMRASWKRTKWPSCATRSAGLPTGRGPSFRSSGCTGISGRETASCTSRQQA